MVWISFPFNPLGYRALSSYAVRGFALESLGQGFDMGVSGCREQ